MACYHPSLVDVERRVLGRAQRRRDAVKVPCGSCLGCRSDQAREWAIRIKHESQVLEPSWFLTLTYAPEHLPENGSLVPRHLSLFIKRLRKRYRGRRISYYACGEYGSDTKRPHYHAVLSGLHLLDRVVFDHRSGAPVWRSPSLAATWPFGIHEFTTVSYAACRYVARYVTKKVRRKDSPQHYSRVDPATGELVELHEEFARMSRRPAIGRRWIEKFWPDVYPRDFVVMDGRETSVPRYYDRYMSLDDSQGGSALRRQIMDEVRYQRWVDGEEIGDPKLLTMEKIHRAKVALFQPRRM